MSRRRDKLVTVCGEQIITSVRNAVADRLMISTTIKVCVVDTLTPHTLLPLTIKMGRAINSTFLSKVQDKWKIKYHGMDNAEEPASSFIDISLAN